MPEVLALCFCGVTTAEDWVELEVLFSVVVDVDEEFEAVLVDELLLALVALLDFVFAGAGCAGELFALWVCAFVEVEEFVFPFVVGSVVVPLAAIALSSFGGL